MPANHLIDSTALQNVVTIGAVAGLAGFVAVTKKAAQESEQALQAQLQVRIKAKLTATAAVLGGGQRACPPLASSKARSLQYV